MSDAPLAVVLLNSHEEGFVQVELSNAATWLFLLLKPLQRLPGLRCNHLDFSRSQLAIESIGDLPVAA